jgi:molecular chaperone GrpE
MKNDKNETNEVEIEEQTGTETDLAVENADLRDQLLRRTAEIENMRRRHEQERYQLIFEANKRLITALLPTLDDLERTIAHIKPEEKDTVAQGIELVYKNFVKVLESQGVTPIDSVGKPFDVHLHDALMEEPRTDVEPGTIVTEIQKGYMLGDSVVRHSKVIVSKTAEEGEAS